MGRARGVAVSLLSCVALGVAPAGCSTSPDRSDAAPPEAAVSTPAAPDGPTDRVDYVALGDSFTAAPGLAGADPSPEGCFRTSLNYPALVAEELPGTRLTDVSCSGATTRDLTRSQRTFADSTVPPQLAAVAGDTDVVTLGIGGNDEDVFATLVGWCARLRPDDPSGAPCEAALSDRLLSAAARTEGRVAHALTRIARKAPVARVLVVGYPDLVPERGTCPRELPLASGDYAFARAVTARLNTALRAAAESAGATYVDVATASSGHDVCSADPWASGRTPAGSIPYHPNGAGQRAVADLVLAVLR